MAQRREIEMQSGTSVFNYYLLSGAIELDIRIEFDEYGNHDITVEYEGLDVTEDALSYGITDKLLEMADNYFVSDSVTAGEFRYECAKNGD